MGILSGPEIIRQIKEKNIIIEPFDITQVGPNSVNVRLGSDLLILSEQELDMKKAPRYMRKEIKEGGYLLLPNTGYLGSTLEHIETTGYVPWIDGRSTAGRYFLQTHMTAGRGDDGFKGTFTLELMAMFLPVRVYKGMPIAQITFFKLEGDRSPYAGRYLGQTGPQPPKPLT